MKYRFFGGELNGQTLELEEVQKISNVVSVNPNLKIELQGKPKVLGYLGPMWGGDYIRYESQKVYNELSSDY